MSQPATPLRILLVDDSRPDRRLVREHLGADDPGAFDITEAETLAEAVGLLEATPCDLVLLDLGLPDSRGFDTVLAMRAAAPRVPVVIFTGTDDNEQALRAIQAGAQDYLVKSQLTKAAIQRTVGNALERYRLENALRESEEKFRTIADFTGDWEYWLRPDGSIVYTNPACRVLTGYSPEEFAADPGLIERIVHPDDREAYRAHHHVCFTPDAVPPVSELELRITRRDGQIRWISHLCHPVTGPDGSNRGRRVGCRDVTARKDAEARTAQKLLQLASLLEISRYSAGDDHELLDFTLHQALQLTGSTIGYLCLYDDAREEFTLSCWSRDVLAQSGAAGKTIGHTLAEIGLWGEAAHLGKPEVVNDFPAPDPFKRAPPAANTPLKRWMSVPVRHEGRIVAVIGVANKTDEYDETDVLQLSLLMEGAWRVKSEREAIDEVRRLNADLEARVAGRTAELADAMQELESFSYSVSHDLRAPLRSIDGFSEALLEECGSSLDATGAGYLTRIRAASHRMAGLIDDLLQLSHVSRHALARAPVSLSSLASDAIAELRRAIPEREVAVAIGPELVVQGDEHLLRILLDNLLGNAWKFTSRTPGARIELGSRATAGRREFFVRDNGAGFDPSCAKKLFVAFQRLHTAKEFPGTGIGLAIVLRIVRRHGGEIRGEGRPGAGAAFTFTLEEPP